MRSLLLALLLSGLTLPAFATYCQDGNTIEMSQCLIETHKAADDALMEAYKKAMSFMGENRQQLRYAQRAWIDFRDKECYARAKPYEEGTIFGIIVGRCEIDMTRHRTRELLKYYRP